MEERDITENTDNIGPVQWLEGEGHSVDEEPHQQRQEGV